MPSKNTKNLEQCLPGGQLVNRAWLKARGFGRPRVDYALRAGKLVALSHGIYRRPGPPLKWEHVVFSLNEMGCPVHVGGRSALELQGLAHYLPLGDMQRIDLYSSATIPAWTLGFSDSFKIIPHTRRLFEELPKTGLSTRLFGAWDWPILCSTPELALLELLADVREAADFSMVEKFFEGAVNLRPGLLVELLTNCKQVKAKRLFLWFSDRHDHAWRKQLETAGIDLGRGKRMLVKGGAYDARYQITVPKQMVKENENTLF
ncbi:type IV toxin-antitoxin system AbiEi family antitoxin domain-containing protein [Desulfobacula sp.]